MVGCTSKHRFRIYQCLLKICHCFLKNKGYIFNDFLKEILPVRKPDSFMSISFPGEKGNKKTQNPKKRSTMKPSRTFNQITVKTWFPIHVSLQSCKKFFLATGFLPRQKPERTEKEVYSVCSAWHFVYVEENRQQKFRINNPWRTHYYIGE